MEIILKEVDRPMVTSFTMFAKPNLSLLSETKTVNVSFHFMTKTRISTSIQYGDYCVKINFEVGEIKQHRAEDMNYFSGNVQVSHYFVVSKKQNFEVYKQYVIELVKQSMEIFEFETDVLIVNLEGKF